MPPCDGRALVPRSAGASFCAAEVTADWATAASLGSKDRVVLAMVVFQRAGRRTDEQFGFENTVSGERDRVKRPNVSQTTYFAGHSIVTAVSDTTA